MKFEATIEYFPDSGMWRVDSNHAGGFANFSGKRVWVQMGPMTTNLPHLAKASFITDLERWMDAVVTRPVPKRRRKA